MVPGAQEVILAAIRDEGGAFEYASEDLKNDYDFALEVVAMGGPGGDGEGRKPRQASHANDHQCWCWIGIAVSSYIALLFHPHLATIFVIG